MAQVQEKRSEVVRTVTGRLSDGSDRAITTHTSWFVDVRLPDGTTQTVGFDHDPGDQEVLDALRRPRTLVPTAKADLEDYLVAAYESWQRWKNTRIEAVARAVAAAVITALTTREDAAWTAYLAVLQQWRTAT